VTDTVHHPPSESNPDGRSHDWSGEHLFRTNPVGDAHDALTVPDLDFADPPPAPPSIPFPSPFPPSVPVPPLSAAGEPSEPSAAFAALLSSGFIPNDISTWPTFAPYTVPRPKRNTPYPKSVGGHTVRYSAPPQVGNAVDAGAEAAKLPPAGGAAVSAPVEPLSDVTEAVRALVEPRGVRGVAELTNVREMAKHARATPRVVTEGMTPQEARDAEAHAHALKRWHLHYRATLRNFYFRPAPFLRPDGTADDLCMTCRSAPASERYHADHNAFWWMCLTCQEYVQRDASVHAARTGYTLQQAIDYILIKWRDFPQHMRALQARGMANSPAVRRR
jgi:hypothetical protein